jgi:hypothetical protein
MRKELLWSQPNPTKPYNPLEKRRLAESIVRELLRHEVHPLPPNESFAGPGIYLIYYRGNFDLYKPLVALNSRGYARPIYVGEAGPPGGRKGSGFRDEPSPSPVLSRRLQDHADSISHAKNLELADFRCRYLVVDEVWITLAESLLIDEFKPLWNVVLDGFGNHDPGKGRHQGKRPTWDTLHPGRIWAERLQPSKLTPEGIRGRVAEYMDNLKSV